MKLALIAVPVVALYSPTVLLPVFATKRVVPSPDNASPMGPLSPRYELRTITPHNPRCDRLLSFVFLRKLLEISQFHQQ